MISRPFIGLVSLLSLVSVAALAGEPEQGCPVTLAPPTALDLEFGEPANWFGSDSLATALPADGRWTVTVPGHRIAVKLFLWSAGFEPGMEKNLSVDIESMTGQEVDAVVNDVTNARAIGGEASAMLVGIDFPSTGCWRITASYLGQSLSFVVETVENES